MLSLPCIIQYFTFDFFLLSVSGKVADAFFFFPMQKSTCYWFTAAICYKGILQLLQ